MNYSAVLFLLGRMSLAIALALVLPTVVAGLLGSGDLEAFLYALTVAVVIGVSLEGAFRQRNFELGRREAFLLVTLAWLTASFLGALPWVFYKGIGFSVDAFFESASGFTTTGASILTNIEAEPAALLLWRSLTQWLGGMGIIVLGIAILPKLAIGGMQLLGAEAPGPTQEKLTPRIAQTAKALWGIYALITLLETGALILAGLTPLQAVNHAFATMSTGGFSTLNGSVAGFQSPLVEWIIVAFMIAAGANFALHFHLLRGRPLPFLRDAEFRFYMFILLSATVVITANLWMEGVGSGLEERLRWAAFQATAIVTTTGFATADFNTWPHFSKALIFFLFFIGGCAGSTGGSVKVVRGMIVIKKIKVELKRLVRPHAVLPVRLGKRAIPEDVVTAVTTFMLLFITLFALGGVLLSAMGLDMVTAFSASATCLTNVGPGFGEVGPELNYAGLPVPAKLLLTAWMLIGRLELYTVLVLVFIGFRLK